MLYTLLGAHFAARTPLVKVRERGNGSRFKVPLYNMRARGESSSRALPSFLPRAALLFFRDGGRLIMGDTRGGWMLQGGTRSLGVVVVRTPSSESALLLGWICWPASWDVYMWMEVRV